ncbi:DUF2156 domain-containing protein [Candidatus Woesearchaeota archaeon]|nr:DUF2156 domain-containing protein [Candidatus Woesearchaeota archaeon]
MEMRLIEDIYGNQELVKPIFNRYGWQAEHNFEHYMHQEEEGLKNVFVLFDNSMGIMAQKEEIDADEKQDWTILAEPHGPAEKKVEMMTMFCGNLFKEPVVRKVIVEFTEEFRKQVFEILEPLGLRAVKPSETLHWPVFRMNEWDHNLAGKDWKTIRNIINRFEREYPNHSIKKPEECDKEKLKSLVMDWKKKRTARSRLYYQSYINLIEKNFSGYDNVRIIEIDGKPAAITGGWKIPNSNNYYSCLGFYDYDYNGIGEFSNIDDLRALKQQGYELVDFGGSDEPILNFKKKFKPNFIYKTFIYSILRK